MGLKFSQRIMVWIILTIISIQGAYPQVNKVNSSLSDYRRVNYIIGSNIYEKATLQKFYGNYTFQNLPIYSFMAGIEYDFCPQKTWSFTTGLLTSMEPIYRFRLKIKEDDLFSDWVDEDLIEQCVAYSMFSFSIPLLIRYNMAINEKHFINLQTGIKIMYFPEGGAEFTYLISSEEQMETREIFGLRIHSQEQNYHGSYIIGSGFSFIWKKLLFKSTLLYVVNFKSQLNGEYLFGNLEQSEDSRGSYKFSGNYFALLFSIGFKKQHNNKR